MVTAFVVISKLFVLNTILNLVNVRVVNKNNFYRDIFYTTVNTSTNLDPYMFSLYSFVDFANFADTQTSWDHGSLTARIAFGRPSEY